MDALQQVLDQPLLMLGGTPVTVGTIAVAVVILLVSIVISMLLQNAMSRAMQRRKMGDEGTLAAMRRLVHYAVMLVGTGIALDTIGVSLGALFAAGAVFAVGLGFAMQNIAQNFVSGIILLIERTIKPGDILNVEGTVVRVIQLGVRSTLVRSRDDEDIIVPNSVLVQSMVKNFTLRDALYRIRVPVGVVYRSNMAEVHRVLRETADQLPWRVQSVEPRVFLREFGDSSVNFEVSVWINDPWDAPAARSKLHQAVWDALAQAGVTIAFPQLDVHFDGPIEESFKALATA